MRIRRSFNDNAQDALDDSLDLRAKHTIRKQGCLQNSWNAS
jgi:hypothetical protein